MMEKDPDAYRTISEVAETLDIPPHVLRFWETKFPQIKPLKRGGGRRFYRRADIDLLRLIRRRLYEDGYTIRGVQRLLKSKGLVDLPAAVEPTRTDAASTGDLPLAADPEILVDAAENEPARALLARIAAEITACQAILSDALQASPLEAKLGN